MPTDGGVARRAGGGGGGGGKGRALKLDVGSAPAGCLASSRGYHRFSMPAGGEASNSKAKRLPARGCGEPAPDAETVKAMTENRGDKVRSGSGSDKKSPGRTFGITRRRPTGRFSVGQSHLQHKTRLGLDRRRRLEAHASSPFERSCPIFSGGRTTPIRVCRNRERRRSANGRKLIRLDREQPGGANDR